MSDKTQPKPTRKPAVVGADTHKKIDTSTQANIEDHELSEQELATVVGGGAPIRTIDAQPTGF